MITTKTNNATPATPGDIALAHPLVGQIIGVTPEDLKLNDDGRTYIARVSNDSGQWIPASRYDKERKRWISTQASGRLGIFVFISGAPSSSIKITLVKDDAKSVHGVFFNTDEHSLF